MPGAHKRKKTRIFQEFDYEIPGRDTENMKTLIQMQTELQIRKLTEGLESCPGMQQRGKILRCVKIVDGKQRRAALRW